MTRARIAGISPFFIVADVPATLAFYHDMLDFEVAFRGPSPEDEFFGILRRDGAIIMVKALGATSEGTEVMVERRPTTAANRRLVGTPIWKCLTRTCWRRSSHRAAFPSPCP